MSIYYNSHNLKYAKSMRSNMTKEEAVLWYHLRAKRFMGLKFKRQVLIGDYIVDFACLEKYLIIELDGSKHNEPSNVLLDKKRSEYLNNQGFKVLRIWNNDVNSNIEGVLEAIRFALEM